MSLIAVSAFGTFAIFVLAGLGALAFAAALDSRLGKERALFVYAILLLALAFFALKAKAGPPVSASAKPEEVIKALRVDVAGEPSQRPPIAPDGPRNLFQKHSETRPLDPIELEIPPFAALEHPLPPPVPGPGPTARRLLRGAPPVIPDNDPSSIPEVPQSAFADYVPQPDDVFDWTLQGNKKYYLSILSLDGIQAGKPGFEERKWTLARAEEGWERMKVVYAMVGFAESIPKDLSPPEVAKLLGKRSRDETDGKHFERWFLRRTVSNLYAEALARNGLPRNGDLSGTMDITALRQAADEMGKVGDTGKEDKEGWRRAAVLLERALEIAKDRAPALMADVLFELQKAYRALRDEQAILRTLAYYAKAAPQKAQAWSWLGEMMLGALHLPGQAIAYFRDARTRDAQFEEAVLGEGDALSFQLKHDQARAAYGKAGQSFRGHASRAEAALRAGNLPEARSAADAALRLGPTSARAQVVRGAVLYAQGELPSARDAFANAAASTEEDAAAWRAIACYDLGLTCWRMGQGTAALAAFDACENALRQGASAGAFPDETVSPSLGRALVALCRVKEGDEPGLKWAAAAPFLTAARAEAPRASYLEMLSALASAETEDHASAVRSLERAMTLAPGYAELDGRIALSHLKVALHAMGVAGGTPTPEASDRFESAVAFAARAAKTEEKADPKAVLAHLREAWTRLQAAHVPNRRRFELARDVADHVLDRIDREQPGARAIRGYCNYRLGQYDECLRDFQLVLDKVPEDPANPWAAWRVYADTTLKAVKKWRSLEEKIVSFQGLTQLPKDWTDTQARGVRILVADGMIHFEKEVDRDGSMEDPSVVAVNRDLFDQQTFEELSLKVRIPSVDKNGEAVNNVVFGILVQSQTGGSGGGSVGGVPPKTPGIGVLYDKAKVAVRVGGGQEARFKEGTVKRLDPEMAWPSNDWVDVRIVREDVKDGVLVVYLNGAEILRDKVGAFREGKRKAELWIGGFGNTAQPFAVDVKDIRVVRVKK
jgi:tetratricopeptide (TPR) repeat protein